MIDSIDELSEINELTKQAYNLAAKKYHDLFKEEMNEKEYDRNILDEFAGYFKHGDTIVDTGCGPSGHIGKYLFDKGLDVIGIDISEKCVENAINHNSKMKFKQMDFCKMEFTDNSFKGIISFYSIIHIPKKYVSQVFKEFKRILKPGGRLILTVKKGNDENFLNDLLGYKAKIYYSYFNENEIKSYLGSNGFKIISIETRSPYPNEISVERIYAVAEKS